MTRSLPRLALPHLSDEAVAAFADGVLRGAAQQRARNHLYECRDCADAVNGQRAASAVLRSATAPAVPLSLIDRLRELPGTAELPPPIRSAAGLSPDGQPVFAAYGTCPIVASPATVSPATVAPAAVSPATLSPTTLRPALLSPATLRPALGFVPPVPAAPPRPGPVAGAQWHRRLASPAVGLAAAAAAAVTVGLLASTAATAGGAAPAVVPTAPAHAATGTGAGPALFDRPAVLAHPALRLTGPR